MPKVLEELEKEDKAITIERETPDTMILYTPVKNADISTFKDDIIYIDEVIEKFKKMKSNKISELTHTKLWQSLNNGDEMPVEVASSEKYVDNNIDIKW